MAWAEIGEEISNILRSLWKYIIPFLIGMGLGGVFSNNPQTAPFFAMFEMFMPIFLMFMMLKMVDEILR